MSAINKISPRLVVAFILAPLVPGFLFLVISLFGNPGEGIWALKLSAMVGYPAMVVLGVPAHLLLIKRHWTGGWSYTLVGMMIGAVVAAVLFGKSIFILGALLGALMAWFFWLIARPNRDQHS